MSNKRRWLITFVILIAVVAVSAGITLTQPTGTGDITVRAVSDGSGGMIIAWQNNKGIYAQRVDSTGQPLWRNGGVFIVKNPDGASQGTHFNLTSDGLAGGIITWADRRGLPDDRDDPAYNNPTPVYTQRIDAGGKLLWGKGIPAGVIKRAMVYSLPQVVPDGTGGVIIAWNDYQPYYRARSDDYLRVKKLDPDGRPLWGPNGVLVVASSPYPNLANEESRSTATRSRPTYEGRHQGLVGDGSGGAIVYWEEETANSGFRALAQRIDAEGNLVWPNAVLVDSGKGYVPESAVSDGSGGAFIVINLNQPDAVRIQHIRDSGELGHSTLLIGEYLTNIVSDTSGGIIILRFQSGELPQDHSSRLYLRRLNVDGNSLWPEDALVYTEEKLQSQSLDMAGDGTGGAIVTWTVWRELGISGKVFTQRVDSGGNTLWTENGVEVFTSPDFLRKGGAGAISDGSGGAIIFAALGKNIDRGDMVYVQRLDEKGNRLWGSGIRIDR